MLVSTSESGQFKATEPIEGNVFPPKWTMTPLNLSKEDWQVSCSDSLYQRLWQLITLSVLVAGGGGSCWSRYLRSLDRPGGIARSFACFSFSKINDAVGDCVNGLGSCLSASDTTTLTQHQSTFYVFSMLSNCGSRWQCHNKVVVSNSDDSTRKISKIKWHWRPIRVGESRCS